MLLLKTKIVFVLITLILVLSCSDNTGKEIPEPPVFKSSIPADNEENVSISSQIEVSFNEVVQSSDSHGITVNNNAVKIEEAYTKILINATLEKNQTYVVNIPKGALINMDGIPLDESIQFSFETVKTVLVNLDQTLVTSNPSAEVVNVYNFFLENYGKKIISATMSNVSWNINEAEWVKQHTGKYPAITTVDYVHLQSSPANWIDYSDIGFIEDWWSNNGLIAAGWHWNVPTFNGSTEYSFYADETTFKASNAIIEGTWENEVIKIDLKKIADYLKLLNDKNIPVIWRPLHEAAGNTYEYQGGSAWFWWGEDGAEAYKKLWIYMFNYFNEQGLDNLIWVWTTQTKDKDFYPGNEYVDIIGRDIYNNVEAASIAEQFTSIQQNYPSKMITLSELGNVATIADQWTEGAHWSYFMPWYDYERTNNLTDEAFKQSDHQYANANWWNEAFNDNLVISRDEMPSLKE